MCSIFELRWPVGTFWMVIFWGGWTDGFFHVREWKSVGRAGGRTDGRPVARAPVRVVCVSCLLRYLFRLCTSYLLPSDTMNARPMVALNGSVAMWLGRVCGSLSRRCRRHRRRRRRGRQSSSVVVSRRSFSPFPHPSFSRFRSFAFIHLLSYWYPSTWVPSLSRPISFYTNTGIYGHVRMFSSRCRVGFLC